MATLAQRLQAEIDRANVTTSKTDTTVHNAIGSLIDGYGQGSIEKVTWHQCQEAVRNYLAAANYVGDDDYSESIINNYTTGLTDYTNTKPIAENITGQSHRNEVPNADTPFASANTAGTLTPLDTLRWINTTSITWVDGVNAFSSVEAAGAYLASHPDTPDRTLFRIYPVEPAGTVPNDREFLIYEDGTLKLFSYYDVGYNVRDLGGWSCDGGTIQYGMLIRGGDTNPTDKHLMVDEIGIRTEVRLFEQSAQGLDHSVWDIDMIVNPTNSVIASSMDKAMWKPLLSGIFDSVSHNRPVYFHCGQGADRTGAMAVMLEAILGVSENDISKDYELTSFSRALRERNSSDFKGIINRIKGVSLLGGLSDTFRNHAVSFALSLGIKIGEINAFRNACINGNPEQISVTLNPYSVTKGGDTTNVVYSNSENEITPYDRYETKLSVPYGMTMTNVTVTMGGIDVTNQYFTGEIAEPTGTKVITENGNGIDVKDYAFVDVNVPQGTSTKYSVSKTLNESTSNNSKTEVIKNEGYGAILTAKLNNDITSITVTMGGVDITSTAVTLIE